MNKNAFFASLFMLFAACRLCAQITVPLKDGNSFFIEGKQILKDPNRGDGYLRETTDTIHYYVHKAASEQVFSLTHYRIPTRHLSKSQSQKTKANFKLKSSENSVIAYQILSFQCAENGDEMQKGFSNHFFVTHYNQSETGKTETICHIKIYFSDKKEAQTAHKRIKELTK